MLELYTIKYIIFIYFELCLKCYSVVRSLLLNHKKPHSLNDKCLVELHLGTSSVSADQLAQVLRNAPNIRLLRHYQLVSALYKLHSESWKSGSTVPTYKLNNLDADFSHVVCNFIHYGCFSLISENLQPIQPLVNEQIVSSNITKLLFLFKAITSRLEK